MFYLLATILLNAVLFCFFKVFPKYKVDALQAIVFNYCTCVVTGSIFMGSFPVGAGSLQQPWLPWAMLMGCCFISIFNLIGYCTRKDGITTTTIANKLSMVIPVLFSIVLYHEAASTVKIIGILLAFPAVYLSTRVKEDGKQGQNLLWPALLFVASGLLDTLVKYTEQRFVTSAELAATFTIHVFLTASLLGLLLLVVLAVTGKIKLHYRNIVAGVLLGVPNYFSIYYFIRLLNSGFLQSSAAIPVNNIGVVVASALLAMLFFKEKPQLYRIIGLVLSVLSILLIAFADGR